MPRTPPFRRGLDRPQPFRPGLPEGQLFRRIDGRIYPSRTMMVAERPGGVMRPGELQSGGAGFYYKGRQQNVQADVLANLGNIDVKTVERQNGQAIPYSERITSPVYFNNKAFQEVMASHGIVIDERNKTLTIQSSEVPKDIRYKLTDEEYQQQGKRKGWCLCRCASRHHQQGHCCRLCRKGNKGDA